MKYILSEEELQEMKDEIRNAKEQYQKICDKCSVQSGMLLKAKAAARRIIVTSREAIKGPVLTCELERIKGGKEAAETILKCLIREKEGDS